MTIRADYRRSFSVFTDAVGDEMSDDADYGYHPAPATLDDVVRELSELGQVVHESHDTFRRHAEDIEVLLQQVIKFVNASSHARSEAEEQVKQHLLAIWGTIAILLVVVILATMKAGLLSWSW